MAYTVTQFVDDWCEGKEFDSCVSSPCAHASSDGCKHPMHPKFIVDEPEETGPDTCPKCGCNFAVHDSDGSCIVD